LHHLSTPQRNRLDPFRRFFDAIVEQLAGHASVVTTARYDRRSEASKRKAVETLYFPLPQQRR